MAWFNNIYLQISKRLWRGCVFSLSNLNTFSAVFIAVIMWFLLISLKRILRLFLKNQLTFSSNTYLYWNINPSLIWLKYFTSDILNLPIFLLATSTLFHNNNNFIISLESLQPTTKIVCIIQSCLGEDLKWALEKLHSSIFCNAAIFPNIQILVLPLNS